MKSLLVINSSPRTGRSLTRKLTEAFVAHWLKSNEGASIIYRDLGPEHVPHMSESWIAAAFRKKELRTAEDQEALACYQEGTVDMKKAATMNT